MSAEDTLRRNKTDLQRILCGDDRLILDKIYEKGLITKREYDILKSIREDVERRVVELVDKIMNKGEKTCQDFLDLLETDQEIKSTFPNLSNLQLHEGSLGQVNRRPKMDRVYPLNSRPVGLCLIINNVNFTDGPVRRGSNKDAHNLAEVFSKLGFRVLMCKNQTKDQMEKTLTWFSSLTDPALPPQEFRVEEWSDNKFTKPQRLLNHGDAFVCCLLSHGVEGSILGTDRRPLYIKHITRTFRATKYSALKGKPKVFLIQASQGDQRVDPEEDNWGGCSFPLEADVLVAIAAGEGFAAFSHPVKGSFFIQSVCQQLREHCPRGEDLLTILQHVKYDVSQKRSSRCPDKVLQMPVVAFTTTKKLVFPLHHR